jgi:N-acetylhexosamine 1-kinase
VDTGFSVPATVLDAFGLDDAHVELLTGGRTNRTLRVRAGRDLVLQQMRRSTQSDLLGIMENLVRVTSHLDWRRAFEHQGDSWYPHLVPANDGKPFIMTAEGDVWRAFVYRKGQILRSAQPMASLASAAAMYGRFSAETADLGGPPLLETAPAFHDLDRIYSALLGELEHAAAERRAPIEPLLATVHDLKRSLDQRCAADGVHWSPDRVVHNDAKLSNVLFDRDRGRATAVLDLDLLMMGPSWHDVGDLIRSACWHAPHGQAPAFSVELFDAVVGAFVEAATETLRDDEIVSYALAGPMLSLELGMRYLHDHLRDEPHLMVRGDNGHFIRGHANIKLAQELLGAYDAVRQIVDGFVDER